MMLGAGLHGFLLAFGLILPLGVQNVFVFNQGALQRKYRYALPILLTASLCDTFLISGAVLGVSVLLLASKVFGTLLMGAGMLFLIYTGWVTWRSKPSTVTENTDPLRPGKQITFGLFVSLLNPHAILDTVGVIGTSSLSYGGWSKVVFAASCILVSWIWFFGLAGAGRIVGSMDREGKLLTLLNKASACVMWGAAAVMVMKLAV